MQFNTLSNINQWFKNRKKNLLKTQIKESLTGIVSILLMTFLDSKILVLHDHIRLTHKFFDHFLFLGFFATSAALVITIVFTFLLIANLIATAFGVYDKDELKINLIKDELHPLLLPYNQKTIDDLIHFLLTMETLSLDKNAFNFPLSKMKELESALIYNKNILEQMDYKSAPFEIQQKMQSNVSSIDTHLANALKSFKQKKLSNNPYFKELLENTSKEEKIKLLKTFEENYFNSKVAVNTVENSIQIENEKSIKKLEQKAEDELMAINMAYNNTQTEVLKKNSKALAL